ncbi:hypothetical protein [Shewanella sp.]|uniref:hypothetical protein n=1 Tax=Shewanella sp. TaxID=50422 RepID=UPI003A881DAA
MSQMVSAECGANCILPQHLISIRLSPFSSTAMYRIKQLLDSRLTILNDNAKGSELTYGQGNE